jgi:hypothetical protein
MLSRPVSARMRGMPGIAIFGKHFFKQILGARLADYGTTTLYEDINVGEKSSTKMQQR